ncbi:olfactory receptor 49-like [Enhydra lutris kenyoni]|uniref:Olfactory receptor 49-like n=1 Tax=Enhydra lutris kenyoni TaxID=391180 RepID=A0A2Y9IG33_ENHLU|nr:olfactory receptor 49-like [Enhydra lutris kenyoni]
MLHTSDWPPPADVRGAVRNHTTITEFVLLGLSDACELQMLIFLGLLLTYLLTLLGNLLIVGITLMDRRLHTPMYYFLRNFAVLEIWFTSVIFPKMLANILNGYKTISLPGCFLQSFLYFFLGTTEFFLLALLELICADTSLIELLGFITAIFSLLGTLSVTATCYGHILHIILRIPSAKERQKAFSTCSSHIIVMSLFYGSCIFMYVRSGKGNEGEDKNKVVALLNTMVTPMLNPFIYTLRNKQVKQVFREHANRLFL